MKVHAEKSVWQNVEIEMLQAAIAPQQRWEQK
jgi:hypothetical protein